MANLITMMDNNRRYAFSIFLQKLKDLNKKDMIGIEIGCYAGESTELFVNSGLFKIFYGIDPWENGYDPLDITNDVVIPAEPVFDARFKGNTIIRKIKNKSENVANNFQNESIDFIYIDGNHQYQAVKKDLELYYPKIKINGIISGHDYEISEKTFHIKGVKKAVNEFFKDKSTFITTFCDSSWMIIKK